MIDLDRELRALFEEDALHAPTPLEAGLAIRRARRRQFGIVFTALAIVAVVTVGSIASVSALLRTSERRVPGEPSEPLAFVCPSGSTPDRPGTSEQARPSSDDYAFAASAFDPGSGRILMIAASGTAWAFDVCTNTWERATSPEGIGGLSELVYDAGAGHMVAIDRTEKMLRVWTLDTTTGTWTSDEPLEVGPVPDGMFGEPPQAAYDPVTGSIFVRDQFASSLWTYDVGTGTWDPIDQGPIVPPQVEGSDPPVQLLTYDASVDRLVLYSTAGPEPRTWEFDVRAGRWTERGSQTPEARFGWFATGEELAYDEANRVSFLFSDETVATYDASTHRWDQVSTAPEQAPGPRLYFAMAYDSVNERFVVAGGDVRQGEDWRPADDVWAFDVESGEWIQLLGSATGP